MSSKTYRMIGKTISHYKIIEILGEGGMGVVYKAEDTKLDRIVALKFLPHHLTTSDTERARFLPKAASALNHPNVCVIYDIKEHHGQQFIVMEYVDGRTLNEIIASKLPEVLNLREVLDYTRQIAEGLQARFTAGTRITKTSTSLGTPAYMSPEQARGMDVDHRADIWSLGVVLYEMLTGELPFKGDYQQAVIYSILHEEPHPFRSDIPDYVKAVASRALEKDQSHGYLSRDFATDGKYLYFIWEEEIGDIWVMNVETEE